MHTIITNSVQQKPNAGGTLIYIGNHPSYKTRIYLKIYKSFELESTFIEICNPKNANISTVCTYKHSNMNISEFNDDYINDLPDKLSKENKTIFPLGDLNIIFILPIMNP